MPARRNVHRRNGIGLFQSKRARTFRRPVDRVVHMPHDHLDILTTQRLLFVTSPYLDPILQECYRFGIREDLPDLVEREDQS